jgi:hypothetical protein
VHPQQTYLLELNIQTPKYKTMTNYYFKQIFSIYSGYVYEFTGNIPDGESPLEYITGQFVTEHGDGQIQTVVTQVPGGKYYLHSFENLESVKFTQVADLSYQEPIIPDPVPDANTEVESVSQGDQ